jgi:putative RNA 2'-phosphotransferase
MTVQLSKFLSLILRHEPTKFGVVLNSGGWTPIDVLIDRIRASGFPDFDRKMLDAVVENNTKKRFTVSDDGARIRAAQGHSVEVNLGLPPTKPPAVLYHGTAVTNLDSIRERGLQSGKRQHVHLSLDRDTAASVGMRHGKPIVLTVAAGQMFDDGIVFGQAENGVWLTDSVPAHYLDFGQNTDS